jgi:hypothetical protein
MTMAQIELYVDKAVKRARRIAGDEFTDSDGVDVTKENRGFLSDTGIGYREK